MANANTKSVGVKFIGSNRSTETVTLVPGNTTADVLKKLGLTNGYQLSDSQKPNIIFGPTDVLFARVEDGSLLHCSALVTAGNPFHLEPRHGAA